MIQGSYRSATVRMQLPILHARFVSDQYDAENVTRFSPNSEF